MKFLKKVLDLSVIQTKENKAHLSPNKLSKEYPNLEDNPVTIDANSFEILDKPSIWGSWTVLIFNLVLILLLLVVFY